VEVSESHDGFSRTKKTDSDWLQPNLAKAGEVLFYNWAKATFLLNQRPPESGGNFKMLP